MSHPLVVHCKRSPFDVYVGRAPGERGRYGNPWVVDKDGTREECIAWYEAWLTTGEGRGHPEATEARRQDILTHIPELRGRRLACWCVPYYACHGEVLARLANA